MTQGVKISFANWDRLCNLIDKFVIKRMGQFNAQKDLDKTPTCFTDLMLQSDVYDGNVQKIANDLIVAMIAGTETSRNSTINTICHLVKDKKLMKRARDEIQKSMQKYNIGDVIDMGHKNTG